MFPFGVSSCASFYVLCDSFGLFIVWLSQRLVCHYQLTAAFLFFYPKRDAGLILGLLFAPIEAKQQSTCSFFMKKSFARLFVVQGQPGLSIINSRPFDCIAV